MASRQTIPPSVELSVVIPTWNAPDLTLRAVSHLDRTGRPPSAEVIVVNDGSDDNTSVEVRSRCPDLTVLDHERNRGFGAAVNTGFRAARGRYLATINNDALVSWDTLSRLCRFLEDHPRASAAAPQLLDARGHWQPVGHALPRQPVTRIMQGRRNGFGRHGAAPRNRVPHQADSLKAACLVFNRTALEQVKLFDEQFHLFAEELDLFHRLCAAGWEAWIVPDVTATHLQGVTTRNHEDAVVATRCRVQSYRSMALYYRKHFRQTTSWLLRGMLAASVSGRMLRSLLSGQPHWNQPRGLREHLSCLQAVLEPCISRPSEPLLQPMGRESVRQTQSVW